MTQFAPMPKGSQKSWRACLQCRLLKTIDQFKETGCDNCIDLELNKDADRLEQYTTSQFDGLLMMMKPTESWVARWQRQGAAAFLSFPVLSVPFFQRGGYPEYTRFPSPVQSRMMKMMELKKRSSAHTTLFHFSTAIFLFLAALLGCLGSFRRLLGFLDLGFFVCAKFDRRLSQ